MHQSTSWTPPTCGQSIYAIQNNSLFLGLYEAVTEFSGNNIQEPCWETPVRGDEIAGLRKILMQGVGEFPCEKVTAYVGINVGKVATDYSSS